MPAYFLAKTEPSVYSIDHLKQDRQTTWDGVRNPQALQAIRAMQPGDRVFIYHSTGMSSVVGLAEVLSESRPDPKDEKSAVIDLKYLAHLEPPTSLAEVKESGLFTDFALVRQSRLSTMAVPDAFVKWLRKKHPNAKI
ncbi:MAG: EVE domain-containing protein [Bryobacteraceae bacterium]|nr:EVE domain-containing protein [Bryobacteraceae bacterium]